MHFNKIGRALLSVTDKAGIVEFARELQALGVEILSTGGTAAQLRPRPRWPRLPPPRRARELDRAGADPRRRRPNRLLAR